MVDQIDDFAQLLGIYRTRAGFTQGELARKMRMSRNTIVAWENNTSRPDSRGHVLRLADELILSKDERETLLKAARKSTERWPTEVWTVPQQKDMFFTGREEVLQLLRALLVPGSAAALTQSISGLGGVGKTHTAVEYAYRYGAYYEAVLWLQADSWEILSSECATLACELGVADLDEHDTMRAVDTVKHWLRTHRYWLLILDNVEDLHLLSQFIPTNHQGSVLITTRVQNPEPLAQTQVLPEMSEQEGILFLLRRTKRVAPNAGLEQASVDHYHEARQIGKLLDGLPLALDQAGAYILETGCSFTAYGKKYEQYRAELLARRGNRFIGHKASVMTTFSLAFDRVISLNPMVADILHVCALLYNEAIPEELFEIGAPSLGPRWAQGPGEWDLAVGMLQDYSLLQRHRNKTLSIHRVVQAVLRESLSKQEEHTWQERIVQILAMPEVFPYPEFKTWDQCKRVLPHALECLHWQNSKTYESDNMTYIALFTAHYLLEHAQHKEAEPLLLQLRETTEQHSDFALLDIVFSMLANLYHFQGQYTEAETWYKLALGASQYL